MNVSSTEHLNKLDMILYDRPAGRNIIGHAIETIENLRNVLADVRGILAARDDEDNLLAIIDATRVGVRCSRCKKPFERPMTHSGVCECGGTAERYTKVEAL